MSKKSTSPQKQLLTILLIVFFGFLGISMPYLIFPSLFLNPTNSILDADWGTSSRAIFLGITLASYPLGQFIGSPILGALSDQFGRKKLLCGSLVVAALCNLLTGYAIEWHHIGLVILMRFAAGLMEGNVAIARAMGTDIKSISKHETFGKINAASSIAFLLDPLIGGLLADNKLLVGVTNSTPFYIISVLFLALSLVSLIILKPDNAIELDANTPKKSVWSHFNIVKKLSVLFKNKRLRFLMIVSTTFTIAVDIFYEFAPVYLTDKWTLTPIQLISYNSFLCVALAIGNGWFAAYFSNKYTNQKGAIGAFGGFALFLLCTLLTDSSIVMMILFALCGLAIGLGVTIMTVKISDSAPDAIQGEVLGVQLSLRVLGDAFICILGGALFLLSSKLILIFAAFLSFTIMLYYRAQGVKFRN